MLSSTVITSYLPSPLCYLNPCCLMIDEIVRVDSSDQAFLYCCRAVALAIVSKQSNSTMDNSELYGTIHAKLSIEIVYSQ